MTDDLGEVFPPELTLCLCGRDPDTPEVRIESAKAVTLSVRYGLVLGGCLWQAAEAYDHLYVTLIPSEARKLDALLAEVTDNLKDPVTDMDPWAGSVLNPTRLH